MKKMILIISSCIIIPIITIIIVYFVSFKPVNIGYIEPLPTNVICVGDEYVIDYKKLSEKTTTEYLKQANIYDEYTVDLSQYKLKTSNKSIIIKDGKLIANKPGICEIYFEKTKFLNKTRRVSVDVVSVAETNYADYTKIENPADFYDKISVNPNGKFIISSDLDFTGIEFITINEFGGILINPDKHKITNITYTINQERDSVLFGTLKENAIIIGLRFYNCNVNSNCIFKDFSFMSINQLDGGNNSWSRIKDCRFYDMNYDFSNCERNPGDYEQARVVLIATSSATLFDKVSWTGNVVISDSIILYGFSSYILAESSPFAITSDYYVNCNVEIPEEKFDPLLEASPMSWESGMLKDSYLVYTGCVSRRTFKFYYTSSYDNFYYCSKRDERLAPQSAGSAATEARELETYEKLTSGDKSSITGLNNYNFKEGILPWIE